MNELVHAFRNAGLVAVTDTIVFDIVRYMYDLVHAFRSAGLGGVAHTIMFDTVSYMNDRVHVIRGAGLGVVTNPNIFDTVLYEWRSTRIQKCGSGARWQSPSYSIPCVIYIYISIPRHR